MEIVRIRKEKGIAFITMNRPKKLNALSIELIRELTEAFMEAERDSEVRVIILSGEGKSFCAGGDISDFVGMADVAETTSFMKEATILEQTIVNLDKFVIAAVHGYAAGAGFSLALASDFIIADREAAFTTSFTRIGLMPDLGLMKNLVKSVPMPLAKEWILSNKAITAQEAYEKGLVNRVVEGDLLEEAAKFAQFIVEGPPLANQFIKYMLNHSNELTHDTNFMQEVIMQAMLLHSEDSKEGIKAFFEKRKPEFKGR